MNAPTPQPPSRISHRLRSWRATCWMLILCVVISNGLFWAPAAALLCVRYGWVSSQTIGENAFLSIYWHAFAQSPPLFYEYARFGKRLGLIDERAYWTMLFFRRNFARDHNYLDEPTTLCIGGTFWDHSSDQVADDLSEQAVSAVFDLASTEDTPESTDL